MLPKPTMTSRPEKAVCFLSSMGDKPLAGKPKRYGRPPALSRQARQCIGERLRDHRSPKVKKTHRIGLDKSAQENI